ncbi:MAG: hypothetical protein NC131_06320 [Roseburia sp.]|nr:hypothetical protein [Roseburia sp.]
MMDLKHLIDYLPFYYKHKDTYKDGNGQGILEKTLEICGTYLQDNIKADIDTSLDILNLETTSKYYLGLLWEMLGQMPFARISSTGTGSLKLTEEQQRNLIRYTNTLLKIRGTEKFFTIMFGIFKNSSNNLSISMSSDDPGWEKDLRTSTDKNYPYFDTDCFDDDNIAFDEYYRMKQCIGVTFTITGNIEASDKPALAAFINRFVPYFVNPTIKINGTAVEETYTIKLFIYDKLNHRWEEAGNSTQVQGEIDYLFKVEIFDSFGNSVSKDFDTWIGNNNTQKTRRTSPYSFSVTGMKTNSDVYHFKMGTQEITHTISRTAVAAPTYAITTPEITGTIKKITPSNPYVEVKVKATKTLSGVTVPVNVVNKNTGEVEPPQADGYARFTISEGGTYKFSPSASYSVESSIEIPQDVLEPDCYDVYVKKLYPQPADTSFSKSSQAQVSNYNPYATFQVILKFNNIPEGVLYNGSPLTADILATLKEQDAKAKMSAEDFAKVKPIIDKAIATVVGIPSINIQSGNTWSVPNVGAYQLMPKNGPQDERLRAVVTKLKQSVVWSVKALDGTNEVDVLNKELTNENPSIEATIQIKQTNTPLLGNTEEDNSLKNMSITLPDKTVVTLKYSASNVEGPGGIYKVEWIDKTTPGNFKVKLTSKIEGTFSFKMQTGESTMAIINIADGQVPEVSNDEVTGICIIPVTNSGWVPIEATDLIGVNRTFQLSFEDVEAKFRIIPALRNADGTVKLYDNNADEFGNFVMPDGSEEELGTVLTFKDKGTYEFKYELTHGDDETPATWSTVKLEIKDWQSTITLEVTPSTGTLQNGQASAVLRISSNKPTDTLLIKELVTGDTYSNGDTFTTHKVTLEDKPYTFVPIVNGEVVETNPDGSSTKKTFKVIDPNAITVTPIILEWDADDLTPKSIKITPGDESTEWIIVTSD